MNYLRRLFAVIVLVASTCTTLRGQDEYPPGTFQLTPEIDLHLETVPLQVPERFRSEIPEDLTLELPTGFTASVFALTGLWRPRLMAFSPEGVLHVADMRGARTKDSRQSRIVAFPDRDGDGVADEAMVVADQLSYANSLAFYKGDLYVAETHQVVRLLDEDRDGVYETREIFIPGIPDIPDNGFHGTRTLVFDEVNETLYLSVGSPCDLCRMEEPVAGATRTPLPPSPEWGTILQFNADGTGRRVFARGIRNAVGMDLHPVTRQPWATHNHYDQGGPNLPPEWIDIIRDGGFYGYPFAYGYQVYADFSISEYQNILPLTRQDSLLVQQTQRPAVLVPAHLAPMAIHFYDRDLFPARYRNAAFVALRGGQIAGNLAVVPGFKIIAVFSQPDGSDAQVADFLTGFKADSQVWGKPVGLTTDPQGNLYVSSDHLTPAILKIGRTPLSASWQHNLPGAVLQGTIFDITATVHLDRFAAAGEPPVLTADLSALGGPGALLLAAEDDGTYQLDISLPMERRSGLSRILVRVEQKSEAGTHTFVLSHLVKILPVQDEVVFAEGLGGSWSLVPNSRIETDTAARDEIYAGNVAGAFHGQPGRLAGWNVEFQTEEPFPSEGYQALRFAFHPGDAAPTSGSRFLVAINKPSIAESEKQDGYSQYAPYGEPINLLTGGLGGGMRGFEIDLERREWQVVEIPLEAMQLSGPIQLIRFFGNLQGTFYLDDLRLVTAAVPPTAVLVENAARPGELALEQNWPNPFNGATVIRFALPVTTRVELAVFDLLGQRVASLARGEYAAGNHAVRWDGRDEQGRNLASGVYLYRLRSGYRMETRKLLLLH